jgi:hypothetical protein
MDKLRAVIYELSGLIFVICMALICGLFFGVVIYAVVKGF